MERTTVAMPRGRAEGESDLGHVSRAVLAGVRRRSELAGPWGNGSK
jgi:hypothetical protein